MGRSKFIADKYKNVFLGIMLHLKIGKPRPACTNVCKIRLSLVRLQVMLNYSEASLFSYLKRVIMGAGGSKGLLYLQQVWKMGMFSVSSVSGLPSFPTHSPLFLLFFSTSSSVHFLPFSGGS